jgi:signal peptidase II
MLSRISIPRPNETRTLIQRGFLISCLVIILDQASKYWIVHHLMASPRIIEVTPFFNVVMVWNKGASFGLFSSSWPWAQFFLGGLALVICVVLAVWLRNVKTHWLAASLGLLIGGALGNAIDRVVYQAVADFLDFHVAGYHWPSFNCADIAITVGVIMLLFDCLITDRRNNKLKG